MGWNFAQELERYGPDSAIPPMTLSDSFAYCESVAKAHYENFTVASWLLPKRLRKHFHAVYAYCRWADDLADETGGGETSLRLLDWWRQSLLAGLASDGNHASIGLAGRASDGNHLPELNDNSSVGNRLPSLARPANNHPVMIALGETIRTFHIPLDPFLNLFTAFEQDQRVKEYETFEQLLGYCANSANPVGRIVLHLFGVLPSKGNPIPPPAGLASLDTSASPQRGEAKSVDGLSGSSIPSQTPPLPVGGRSPRFAAGGGISIAEDLSDAICTGLQLANFWQDVARDRAIGRIYLPKEDRERFGVTDLVSPSPAFRELLKFQVERTRGFFDRGRPLLQQVLRECRVDLDLFLRGGEAILRAIEKQNFDVLTHRPTVGKWAKVRLLMRAVVGRYC